MLAGTGAIAYLTVNGLTVAEAAPFLPPVLQQLKVGVLALVINLAVLALVTLATGRRTPAISYPGTA
ncbi:MAG TPA: hypothetical protein VFV66_23125 [Nonomuraea sp.]|nr:hypothetical protein [Nonomuraea sp.]